MLNHDERKKYVTTLYYKMVLILSGYRRLIDDPGSEIVNRIQEIWACDGKKHETMDSDFMIFVDLGYIELGEEEVRAYFDVLYDLYGLPKERKEGIYDDIKQCAKSIRADADFDDISNRKRAQIQIQSMVSMRVFGIIDSLFGEI